MRQYYQVSYYIPSDSGIRNPSGILRYLAARFDGSTWIMESQQFNNAEFIEWTEEMRQNGGELTTLPYDMSAAQDILRVAAACIARDVKAAVNRHKASAEDIVNRMTTSRKPPVQAYIESRKRLQPVLKRMKRRVEQYENAANLFGLKVADVHAARNALQDITSAVLERSKAFLATAAAIEKVRPGDLMARAARMGKVPYYILADYAEELPEVDQSAVEKLRKFFG